jgi:hypothetical protein
VGTPQYVYYGPGDIAWIETNPRQTGEIACPACGGSPFVSLEGDVIPCCKEMPQGLVDLILDLIDPPSLP